MTAARSGYLLLSDISGYTAFLSDSELEHARDTLTDLLTLLIDHAKPPLLLSKLEGDAVFSYTWGEDAFKDGQVFVELIENTYVAFRRAIELMVMNNTCRCAACANVSKLDLKFFVHHGTFAQQDLGSQVELVGTDVNLVHRMMKNSVREATGATAYTLYTDAAVRRLAIEAIATTTMTAHTETLDDLGDVRLWVQDMHPVWERRRDEHRIEFEPRLTEGFDMPLPPDVIWGYLRQPRFRSVLMGVDRVDVEQRRAGRIGIESEFQCFHGNHVMTQRIVEWTPFDRIVTQETHTAFPMNKLTWRSECLLTPTPTGTHLRLSLGQFEGPRLLRTMMPVVLSRHLDDVARNLRAFAEMIEADWAEHHEAGVATPVEDLTPESIRQAAGSDLPSH